MPVLREDQERQTGRRGRRWLWMLAVPPVVFIGLLLLPLRRPVTVEVGDYCFFVRFLQRSAAIARNAPFAVEYRHVPMPVFEADGPGKWMVSEGVYATSWYIGGWDYRVVWWRGQKVAAPSRPRP